MGAKTWMLAYVDGNAGELLKSGPTLDREASVALGRKLFASERLEMIGEGNLSRTSPPDDEVYIGCFPGISIVAAKEFGIDFPSKLPAGFLTATGANTVCLHAMHSAVDWFAYAIWTNGILTRALSLSPDSGILEDIGPRLAFEDPYWSGAHSPLDPEDEDDEYPFPFHPLELGEAALLALFGYQLEGYLDPDHLKPETIPLIRFRRSKQAWWLFRR